MKTVNHDEILYLRDLLFRYVERWPGRGVREDADLIDEVKAARLKQTPQNRARLKEQVQGALDRWEQEALRAER